MSHLISRGKKRFRIELFGVQNNSTNTVLTDSKVKAGISFLRRETELVSLSRPVSLLSFTQIICNKEHQCCQVITE